MEPGKGGIGTMDVYVHRTRGTIHTLDCKWLAGAFTGIGKTKPEHYTTAPTSAVSSDAPTCSHCRADLPMRRRG